MSQLLDLVLSGQRRVVEIIATGELDLSTAPALTARLAELEARDIDVVRVDLSSITFIDSRGILALLRAGAAAHHGARRLEIVASRQVLRGLELAGVADRLPLVVPDT